MTGFARLVSAALAATSVAALGTSAANAAAVTIRPTITIAPVRPTVSVRPAVNVQPVRPVVPTVAHAPVLPATHIATLPATHVATLPTTHAPTLPATHAPVVAVPGVPLPPHHVAIPANPTSSTAAELGGKPVIKVSYVKGNELTVYYLSQDAQHIVGVVSGISAPASQPPATHVPPQPGQQITATPVSYNEITDALGRPIGYVNAQGQSVYFPNGQMPAGFTVGPNHKIDTYITTNSTPAPPPQPPSSSKPPANSGQQITATPVSYNEITDALGRPIGYVNAQGQSVYFPNGQMPAGFTVGPNHKIETYITTTSTPAPTSAAAPAPAPANKPAPPPQQPAASKPAAPSSPKVTFTPVKYRELTDAYGAPIGYVNAEGQAVYFPNGHMPQGFSIGPNHTIETYIKS